MKNWQIGRVMRSEMLARLCGLLMAFQTSLVLAQTAPLVPGTRTISVNGRGESKTKPDLMIISFGVYTTAPSGDQCTRLQAQKSHDVIDALRAVSEAKVKIETFDYSLSSSDQPENPIAAQPEEVSGWTFKTTITAGSENMAILGAVLDAGLAAGATDIAGSGFDSFGVENSTASPSGKVFNYTPKFSLDGHSPIPVSIATDQSEQPQRSMPSVSVEVETQGATADEAVRRGTQITDKVLAALRDKLGPHGALRLENFTILRSSAPQAPPVGLFRTARKVYTARTTITANTSDLDALGALLEAGMKAGATQLNSVSFTVSDPQAAGNDAIAQASKNARGKAAAVAASMNVKLGKILSISTNAQVQPQTIYGSYMLETMAAQRAYAARSADTLPVLPKELGVVADVSVVYEIQ